MVFNRKDNSFFLKDLELYNRKIRELKISEEKVAWLLNKYPKLRDSDKLLCFHYWTIVDKYKGELNESIIISLTPAETITRVRRLIQNTYNMFLPLKEETIKQRSISEKAVRAWAKNKINKFK